MFVHQNYSLLTTEITPIETNKNENKNETEDLKETTELKQNNENRENTENTNQKENKEKNISNFNNINENKEMKQNKSNNLMIKNMLTIEPLSPSSSPITNEIILTPKERKERKEWQQGKIVSKTPQERQFFQRKQFSTPSTLSNSPNQSSLILHSSLESNENENDENNDLSIIDHSQLDGNKHFQSHSPSNTSRPKNNFLSIQKSRSTPMNTPVNNQTNYLNQMHSLSPPSSPKSYNNLNNTNNNNMNGNDLSSILDNIDQIDYSPSSSPRYETSQQSNQFSINQNDLSKTRVFQSYSQHNAPRESQATSIAPSSILTTNTSLFNSTNSMNTSLGKENQTVWQMKESVSPTISSSRAFFIGRDNQKKQSNQISQSYSPNQSNPFLNDKFDRNYDKERKKTLPENFGMRSDSESKPSLGTVVLTHQAKQQIMMMSKCQKLKRKSGSVMNLDRKRKYMTWKASEGFNIHTIPKLTYNPYLQTRRGKKPQQIENEEFLLEFEPLKPIRTIDVKVNVYSTDDCNFVVKK